MAFLNQGSSKTPLNVFGEVRVKTFWPKTEKVEIFFPLSFFFPLDFFYRVFLPFLGMRTPKSTIKIFPKSDLKIPKISKIWQVRRFFFFFVAPWAYVFICSVHFLWGECLKWRVQKCHVKNFYHKNEENKLFSAIFFFSICFCRVFGSFSA
jgi:hypothetical protein